MKFGQLSSRDKLCFEIIHLFVSTREFGLVLIEHIHGRKQLFVVNQKEESIVLMFGNWSNKLIVRFRRDLNVSDLNKFFCGYEEGNGESFVRFFK